MLIPETDVSDGGGFFDFLDPVEDDPQQPLVERLTLCRGVDPMRGADSLDDNGVGVDGEDCGVRFCVCHMLLCVCLRFGLGLRLGKAFSVFMV
jgi:hypothetical protein